MDNEQQSTVNDANIASVAFWVSRSSQYDRERVTQQTAGNILSQVTGPDGIQKSGVIFQA
jgi:hypothetical protein